MGSCDGPAHGGPVAALEQKHGSVPHTRNRTLAVIKELTMGREKIQRKRQMAKKVKVMTLKSLRKRRLEKKSRKKKDNKERKGKRSDSEKGYDYTTISNI